MILYFIPSSDAIVWPEDHVVVLKIDVLTDGFLLMGMWKIFETVFLGQGDYCILNGVLSNFRQKSFNAYIITFG